MTLDELTTPLTKDEVQTAILDAMAASGVDTTSWKPGAVARTIIAGVAIVIAALSVLIAAIARSGFLDLSSGDWRTLVAKYVYGVERESASFGTCTVTLTNNGGAVYAGDPGDLVMTSTTSGKSYRNTAAFNVGALQANVEIPLQAIEAGTDSNIAANQIDGFETALNGVVIVSSTACVASDDEDDAALRLRCLEKTAALSPNGPRDAYAYIARTATLDGMSIGVTRVRTIADGAGNVDIYAATASGNVSGSVGDTTTALGAIDDAIQTQVVPECVTATTHSATPLSISITYELWVRDTIGKTSDQLQDDIEDALTTYLASVPIGGEQLSGEATGRVYVTALYGVIARAVGSDELARLAITLPAADVDCGAHEAPVIGTPTCTDVHFVTEEVA